MSLSIPALKASLAHAQQTAAELFYQKQQPAAFFQYYVHAIDNLLSQLWEHFFSQHPQLYLLATGGFGRQELYPQSDLDLAIVSETQLTSAEQEHIAQFIQTLWDIHLHPAVKVGSINEIYASIDEDITGDTAFLEARFLCGNQELAEKTIQKINQQRNTSAFIEAKLLEMQQRHEKYQGSGAVLEPNIKSCPGGLRDIHTMMWIARAQGLDIQISDLIQKHILTKAEASMLTLSYKQLALIRIHLHLLAKRSEDRLLFDLQTPLAEQMGEQDDKNQRASEKLMRLFYRTTKTVKQLNGILIPMLQGRIDTKPNHHTYQIDEHYYQLDNQIAVYDKQLFSRHPEHLFKILHLWQSNKNITAIEPKTLRAWWDASRKINRAFYQNSDHRMQFIQLFKQENGLTQIMRFLNLYGVLERYIPAWRKIVGLLQHDLFHIYPVDDHILTVLHNIRRFAMDSRSHEQPFASALMQAFPRRYVLYLAAIFHDIAKGRGGDHSIQGIGDARTFAQDHHLPKEDESLLTWLVEAHLLMSTVAQKEDIQDPDVIADFCAKVKTQERLNALYLLTIADIRGTNPKLWNNWRASLLETLFHSTSHHLAGNANNRSVIFSRRQQEAIELLSKTGTPEKLQKRLWDILGSAYFVRHQSREILWHTANLVHNVETPLVRSRILPESDTFQVMIFMPNGERLFARLCRIFSRHGFNILAARAFITEHDYILDTFIVQIPAHHNASEYPNIQSALEAELNNFIHGYSTHDVAHQHIKKSRRSRYISIAPNISISHDEDYPHWYTIDVVAINRAFLLADLAEILFNHHVSIRYAKIATLDERVEDSFIVYAPTLENPKEQFILKQALLEKLA